MGWCHCVSKSKLDADLEQLRRYAARSDLVHHRHACMIFDHDGELVSAGWNFMLLDTSVHAEKAALHYAKYAKCRLRQCTVVVARIGTDAAGRPFKMSKPCAKCRAALRAAGVKHVLYTTGDEHNVLGILREEDHDAASEATLATTTTTLARAACARARAFASKQDAFFRSCPVRSMRLRCES